MLELLTLVLGVYGVVTILVTADAPYNALRKLRDRFRVFECEMCLSIWIAAIPCLWVGTTFWEYLAVVGGTILIVRVTEI